jgi:predicted secreted protein
MPKSNSGVFAPLVTVLTATAALLASMASHAEPAREHQLVNLQAEVVREVKNDQMQATLYTERNHSDPTVLAQTINQAINDAMTTARRYPSVQVSTGSQNTYPLYDDKQKATGWRARAEIQLKSTDFKAASELIALLQSKLQVESVRFNVSPEQRTRVENELLGEVTRAFRQRADLLKTAWNASGYELVNVDLNTSSDSPPVYPMYRMAMAKDAAGAPETQQVEGGDSKVRVSASGTIQLK